VALVLVDERIVEHFDGAVYRAFFDDVVESVCTASLSGPCVELQRTLSSDIVCGSKDQRRAKSRNRMPNNPFDL
jgi:hypothetical protein